MYIDELTIPFLKKKTFFSVEIRWGRFTILLAITISISIRFFVKYVTSSVKYKVWDIFCEICDIFCEICDM